MDDQIQTMLERARRNLKMLQAELNNTQSLSLRSVESIYNLRKIRISVAYRRDLDPEEQEMVEEICRLSQDGEEIWEELEQRSRNNER